MKWVWIILGSLLAFAALALSPATFDSGSEDRMIREFVKSRGKTEMPKTWRGQVGDGI
jgi:hypothetical protein